MGRDLGREARAPRTQQLAVEQKVLLAHDARSIGSSSPAGFRFIMTAMSMSEADTAISPGPVEAAKGRPFAVSLSHPRAAGRSSPAAGLHRLPGAHRQARAHLRRLLRQNRFHRASSVRPARRAAAL